ncbi:MAG: VOC family protein [Marinomonas colpomeniae]
MNIRFDHLSLSAKEPEKIKDFLIELLDLEVKTRPDFSFSGYFLFAGDKDVIHIFPQQSDIEAHNLENCFVPNIVHHVSFFSDNYDEVMQKIAQMGLRYNINNVPNSPVKQFFVRAPENLIIEIQAIPNNDNLNK